MFRERHGIAGCRGLNETTVKQPLAECEHLLPDVRDRQADFLGDIGNDLTDSAPPVNQQPYHTRVTVQDITANQRLEQDTALGTRGELNDRVGQAGGHVQPADEDRVFVDGADGTTFFLQQSFRRTLKARIRAIWSSPHEAGR